MAGWEHPVNPIFTGGLQACTSQTTFSYLDPASSELDTGTPGVFGGLEKRERADVAFLDVRFKDPCQVGRLELRLKQNKFMLCPQSEKRKKQNKPLSTRSMTEE